MVTGVPARATSTMVRRTRGPSVRLQASTPHGHDGEHHAHAHALEQRDAALDAGEPFLSGLAREATWQQASEQSATFKISELNELINTTSNIQAET